jgi:type IV pilus assembly protein PilV
MLGARGCITSPAANVYLIEVAWQGLNATTVPPAALICGSGQYGNENLRREVTTIVQIGILS